MILLMVTNTSIDDVERMILVLVRMMMIMLMVTNTDDDERMAGCHNTQIKDGDDTEAKEDDSLTPCGHIFVF